MAPLQMMTESHCPTWRGAKKRAGKESELMDTLIAYKHSDMFKLG
jgi:hypothetical protein